MAAFPRNRSVNLQLDRRPAQRLIIAARRQRYRIGPFTLTPGVHEIVFDALEPMTVADEILGNGDPRPLSIAFGTWEWSEQGAP